MNPFYKDRRGASVAKQGNLQDRRNMPRATKEPIGKVNLNALDDFDTNSLDKLSRDIFPAHTELDAYNQLASKLGLGPLSQQEYDELQRTGRRPDPSRPAGPGDPSITANPISNESKIMNKKLIRLTESDLHRIVKESAQRIIEAMETPGGQFQGGRLAYRKGEEKPIPGNNIGKLRKSKDAPIFNYAEKAAKKSKLGGYGRDFRKGYDYQQTLDNFDNAGSREEKLRIAAVNSVLDLLRGIRNGEGPFANGRRLEDMSDEELRDYVKNRMINDYFPKDGI